MFRGGVILSNFSVSLCDARFVGVIAVLFGFLYIPAFIYGLASIWIIIYLFVFMRLGRMLCQSSLRRYEERICYTNETPKFKGIVVLLCAYLSLPFIAYIFIVGDLNASVSGGLDRALIMILPFEAIKLPIDGDPSVFQMLLLHQLLLSFFGWGGGMLLARREISALSLPKLPKNIPWSDDLTQEEKRKYQDLGGAYYFLGGVVSLPAIFSLVFATFFFGRFWTDSDIHVLEYIFVLPSIFFMPYVFFLQFFATAVMLITIIRGDT